MISHIRLSPHRLVLNHFSPITKIKSLICYFCIVLLLLFLYVLSQNTLKSDLHEILPLLPKRFRHWPTLPSKSVFSQLQLVEELSFLILVKQRVCLCTVLMCYDSGQEEFWTTIAPLLLMTLLLMRNEVSCISGEFEDFNFNGRFGGKEEFMTFMNQFIETEETSMKTFLRKISVSVVHMLASVL